LDLSTVASSRGSIDAKSVWISGSLSGCRPSCRKSFARSIWQSGSAAFFRSLQLLPSSAMIVLAIGRAFNWMLLIDIKWSRLWYLMGEWFFPFTLFINIVSCTKLAKI
jgi:hypothetical protein